MKLKKISDFISFSDLFSTTASTTNPGAVVTPYLPPSRFEELIECLNEIKKEDINIEEIHKLIKYIMRTPKYHSEYQVFNPYIPWVEDWTGKGTSEMKKYLINGIGYTNEDLIRYVEDHPGFNETLMNWSELFYIIDLIIKKLSEHEVKYWMTDELLNTITTFQNSIFQAIFLIKFEYGVITGKGNEIDLSEVRSFKYRRDTEHRRRGEEETVADIFYSCLGIRLRNSHISFKSENDNYIGPWIEEYPPAHEYHSSI